MLGRFSWQQNKRPALRAVCLLAACAAARAVPVCATWRDDRPPGSDFWCLLESSAEFFSIFNRSTSRFPTSNAQAEAEAEAGFCPVISSRSTTTWPVNCVMFLQNRAQARCSAVCG